MLDRAIVTSPDTAVLLTKRACFGTSRVVAPVATLLACAGLLPREVSAQVRLTQPEIQRLERGEVVTRYWKLAGGNVGTGVALGLVDASPEKVFAVIADVARYKDYMNRVVESRITARRSGGRYDFYYKIDMPWPLSDYWFVTDNVHALDRERRVYRRSWTLKQGSFARNEGSWRVEPRRGERSLVTYSSLLQPRSMVPQFVINHVTRRSLPMAITNLRSRVAHLARRGEL